MRTETTITTTGISSTLDIDRGAPCEQTADRIRVLIVGMRMYTQLLARALIPDQNFDPVETDCEEAATAVSNHRPQVAVINAGSDRELSKGFDIVRQLRVLHPQTQVVILLESNRPQLVLEAFRAGASGVLSRGESLDILKKCIRCVHRGQIWASSGQLRLVLETLRSALPAQLVDFGGKPLLSKREQDVVRGIAEGMTNREIAEHLKLSAHTVKNYVFRIFDRLGVSSRVEVVLYVVSQASKRQPDLEPSTDFLLAQSPVCRQQVRSTQLSS
ncbi:MAG: response regulator transcription factor [Acidobacteriia bacterium]|nr:response regulator transcription factor [Terriglobia bacterium]